MSVKRSFLIAAMVMAVCACEKERNVEVYVPDENEIQLNMIYPGMQTRVTDNSFDVDDQIGVYVTAAEYSEDV